MIMEQKLTDMINEAKDLWNRSKAMKDIPGASKLERKINSELKCLVNFRKGKMKDSLENHLKSTNLTNLRAVVKAIENSPQVTFVLKSFYFEQEHIGGDTLVVDAVVTGGYKWIKIIARKPIAVHKIFNGEGNYGDKDIVSLAKDYILASDQNHINYEAPGICFVFPRGVTKSVHEALKNTGVFPIGKVLPDPDFDNLAEWKLLEIESNLDEITQILMDFTSRCNKINLDITTLIVLTSNITNGECDYAFKEEILTKQAEEERVEPALGKLQRYLQGKELICCQTAYDNFDEILTTVGGPTEKQRAHELFQRVTIIPDEPAYYAMDLEESASVKLRSKIIFGTGETMQAITATANTAFVRAAVNQGIKFSTYFHASRALTEQKQKKAIPIPSINTQNT